MRAITTRHDLQAAVAEIGPAGDANDWHAIHGRLTVSNSGAPNSSGYRTGGSAKVASGSLTATCEVGTAQQKLQATTFIELAERFSLAVWFDPKSLRVRIDVRCDEQRYQHELIHGRLVEPEGK